MNNLQFKTMLIVAITVILMTVAYTFLTQDSNAKFYNISVHAIDKLADVSKTKEVTKEVEKKDIETPDTVKIDSKDVDISILNDYNKDAKSTQIRRIKQFTIALKYFDLPATKENVKKFCQEAELLNPEMSYGVAQKETAFTKGTGKYHNMFGFKRANNRFTTSEGRARQNNSYYLHWTLSVLDHEEFLRAGKHNWSAYKKGYK